MNWFPAIPINRAKSEYRAQSKRLLKFMWMIELGTILLLGVAKLGVAKGFFLLHPESALIVQKINGKTPRQAHILSASFILVSFVA